MRYPIRTICICALSVMPLAGCGGNDEAQCNTARDCDDRNECTADSCDPTTGSCSNAPLEDGAMCQAGACQSGSCEPIASVFPCTEQGIRAAIAEGGGPHAFDCAGPTVVAPEAQIVIDNDVILDGQDELEVNGNGARGLFFVPADVTVELRRLAVTGGNTDTFGGGIWNLGTTTLTNCTVSESSAGMFGGGISNGDVAHEADLTIIGSTVSENAAESGSAGGIASWGTLTVMDSTVSGNTAVTAAGIGNSGAATVTNTTVSGNTAFLGGGGIWNDGLATLTLTNSTVSGNSADAEGGGMINWGTATINNCTFADNAAGRGSAIGDIDGIEGATLTVVGSLIEGACSAATIISNGYNIESPGETCGFDRATDQVDVTNEELNLGPLADNGGPTKTHSLRLMPESAAIDAIPEEQCLDSNGNPLVTDQRGQPRPETGGARCDVGAFELERGGP